MPGLATIVSPLSAEVIVDRLDASARRGKLAGFARGRGDDLFTAAAHGTPFDRVLVASAESASDDTRLAFAFRWTRKWPVFFAIVLVVTVWPGLPLTDSLMTTYFGWYERWVSDAGWLRTWMWYLPLTVPFVPLVWRTAMGRSRVSSHAHAIETIEKIALVVDGHVEEGIGE